MKLIWLTLTLLLSVEVMALSPRDTVVIDDLWTKTDTTGQLKKLNRGQELNKEQEMQLFDRTKREERRRVRIISSEESVRESRGRSSLNNGNKPKSYRRFRGHWCGINLGFLSVANTDYSGYEYLGGIEFMEPDYSQSFTLQANIFEESISLVPRNNLGLVLGLGLEYQHMQLDHKDITFRRDNHNRLQPYYVPHDWDMKKNFFKNIYLTVPLLVELQLPARYRKLYFSAGVVGGIRLHTKTKLVYYNEEGWKKKRKKTDHYNVRPIKADLMATVGYGSLHVWSSYSLTGLFRSDKGPEVHPCSIGVGVSF